MRVFLAALPMDPARVVVVGVGEPALAKLRLFLTTRATLVWFAPGEAPAAEAVPRSAPAPERRTPGPADFAGARLVFIAVEDEAEAARLASEARSAGALVNVVDRPALSDFHTPALIDRDQVVVGIATGGAAPILARDLRARIEAVVPASVGVLASLAGELRDTVKASIPDFLARRRFWERAFRGAAADLTAAGRLDEARREILRELAASEPGAGSVAIVGAGPGDPELLTLKALAILQDADLLIHDNAVGEAILARARRDASRVSLGPAGATSEVEAAALMIREAASGCRVVRLHAGDPGEAGRRQKAVLEAAGVVVIVVPGLADG
ncbi:NAD(P)-dependent oxidoreductase [Brevundimonas sp.]|uniref:NAD(P)-dependent oxidoreductase n=1 Tax=Brevundimonas sp. TaxID=1871086 RepID=UPI002D64C85E|nr:NAD(P)-dependent oxidoreductase [Brevundimonas sp.]HYC98169.1 NAD(P)-dependent oxidoreductase [Brevundimonas sp.]